MRLFGIQFVAMLNVGITNRHIGVQDGRFHGIDVVDLKRNFIKLVIGRNGQSGFPAVTAEPLVSQPADRIQEKRVDELGTVAQGGGS